MIICNHTHQLSHQLPHGGPACVRPPLALLGEASAQLRVGLLSLGERDAQGYAPPARVSSAAEGARLRDGGELSGRRGREERWRALGRARGEVYD